MIVGAAAVVAVVLAVGVVVALRSDDVGELSTAAAADRLSAVIDDALVDEEGRAELERCPFGEEVLQRIADDLGGQVGQVVDDGEVSVTAGRLTETSGLVDCTAATDEDGVGAVGVLAADDPAAFADQFGEPDADGGPSDVAYVPLGEGRGGTFSTRCERGGSDCAVVWADDRLVVGIGGSGPAFEDVTSDDLKTTLDRLLPNLVDGLAG